MRGVPIPVSGKAHRLTLGLRPLDPADWILVDADRDAELAEKSRLMSDRRDTVTAVTADGYAGSAETESMLVRHLAEHHGTLPRGPVPPTDAHPIERAALMVQEDLCVMVRNQDGWVLSAASVCFPSRWSLAAKIGRTLDAIHSPVPGYGPQIASPTRLVFDRLTPDRPLWRVNWTLLPDAALHQTGGTQEVKMRDPADLTLRLERQTLRALPDSGTVLFTIRTIRHRLGDVVRHDPDLPGRLASTLATIDAETAAYKGWEALLPRLLDWLREPSAAGDPAAWGRTAAYRHTP